MLLCFLPLKQPGPNHGPRVLKSSLWKNFPQNVVCPQKSNLLKLTDVDWAWDPLNVFIHPSG